MPLLRPPLRAESERGFFALNGRGQTKAKASPKPEKGGHLYLVDGSGYIFRAYHALPPLTRKSDGLPTGAVAGFCNMLHRLLKETRAGDAPTHLAVVFDTARKTFRNDIYPEYKANRPPPPEDLIQQFPLEIGRASCRERV